MKSVRQLAYKLSLFLLMKECNRADVLILYALYEVLRFTTVLLDSLSQHPHEFELFVVFKFGSSLMVVPVRFFPLEVLSPKLPCSVER